MEALLRAVPDDQLGPTDRALYLTAAMTGLRQGELFALRWRDVDWAADAGPGAAQLRSQAGRGGGSSDAEVQAVEPARCRCTIGSAQELERHFQRSAYQADEDLVFRHPHTGRPLDSSKVLKRFKEALRAAGIRPLRFHDLRHTFGTRMAAAGVPMRALQEWMGHRDFKTTMIYADYAPVRPGARAGRAGLRAWFQFVVPI